MSANPKRRRAIGAHHSAASKTNNWFTPRKVTEPLGPFDTDPATSERRPWDIAATNLTRRDGALSRDWRSFGRIWLNPPYALRWIVRFIGKLSEHGNGIALIFNRSDARWFVQMVDQRAHGILTIAGRLHFCRPSGKEAAFNAGAPSVLVAYGANNLDVLADVAARAEYDERDRVIWPQGKIPGTFRPTIIPRSVLVMAIADRTWREIVSAFLADRAEPVRVADLYAAFAFHPKARRNPNWKPKLRQTLQRGAGRSIGRDQWVAA